MSSLNIDKQVISILQKCHNLNHLKQLQSFLTTLGHSQTQFLTFKLVRFCILSLSNLPYAHSIFNNLKSPNVYLYTAMITAYSSHPQHHSSTLILYRNMIRHGRPKPNHFIFPHVLKCSGTGSLHSQVLKFGYGEYSIVQTALIDSYLKCCGDVLLARKVFDEMSERNVVSWTAMVSGYLRFGEFRDAVLLFDEMNERERDVVSWNAVIAGCIQSGMFLEAISFFNRMMMDVGEVVPNQVTIVCVLSACGNLGMLNFGRCVHGYIFRNEIGLSTFVVNALVDMYGKCGSMKEARKVFDQTFDKGLTLWNSMINCLALHGQSENAIRVFEEMMKYGGNVKPDEVTFVGLLNACTHGGLVEQGYTYFNMMTRDYNVEPEIQHYGCVVDLLCRAGKFDEAMEIVKGMKIKPDEVLWGSFLNGSKIHGRRDLAEYAVTRLIEIDPNNASYGVMLANIHGEAGNWHEVGKVRKFLKEQGAQKTPGCSWIEIDKQVRQFYSRDTMHPETEEIYRMLDCLICPV